MNRTIPTRREKVEARESAILEAAHREFSEHGFEGAKVAQIAQRAGVAEGTLYLYFKNKQALLQAVIARFYETLTAGAAAGVADHGETFDRLEFLARYHLAECLAEWRILELLIGSYRSLPDYEDRGYRALNRTYVAVFDGVLREGIARGELREDVPLWQVRDLFYGMLEYSARTLMLRDQAQQDLDDVVAHAIGLLRRGMERSPGRPDRPSDLERITQRLERVAEKLDSG